MKREEAEQRVHSETLVEAARQGDRGAFEELYRRYHRLVVKRVVVLVGAGNGEEDLVQETFARAYQQLPRFRGDAPFPHWLLGIATNLARSAHRRRRRWRLLPFSSAADTRAGEGASARYPELKALHQALEALSITLREALLLYEIEGLTLQELATCQQVSLNTAASRVRRGRKRLRRELLRLGFDAERKGMVVGAACSLGNAAAAGICEGETR